jgi:hypothetical protein
MVGKEIVPERGVEVKHAFNRAVAAEALPGSLPIAAWWLAA